MGLQEFFAAVDSCTQPVSTIVEAGSRDGRETRAIATRFPRATVHTFEPNPEQTAAVLDNLRGLNNASLYSFALSDRTGSSPFFGLRGNLDLVGSSGVLPIDPSGYFAKAIPLAVSVEVPAIRLDEWADTFIVPSVDAAWIDVEGAELPVLRGFGKLLDCLCVLHIERHYERAWIGQSLAADVDDFLGSAGFAKTWENPTPPARYTDALFVRV